jgi:hypothetical protein
LLEILAKLLECSTLTLLSRNLVLAWPGWGAGDGPGDERGATGIAWHVEASANEFVGSRPLAGGDFIGRSPS